MLCLNGPQPVLSLGHKVNPCIRPPSGGPIVPTPDSRHLPAVLGRVLQHPLAQALEVAAAGSESIEERIEVHEAMS